MKHRLVKHIAAVLFALQIFIPALIGQEYKSGIVWPEPPVVTPGDSTKAPSDAIVLFDGTDMSNFENGEKWIVKDLSLIHI